MSGSFEFTIQQAVCLFPACIAVHFLEGAFGHVGPESDLATIYLRSLAQSSRSGVGVCACGLRGRVAVDTTGADIPVYPRFRRYSPGTTSALVLFPAVCWHVVSPFSHSAPLSAGGVLPATVIGAAFHTIDLASTTFFLHRKPPR